MAAIDAARDGPEGTYAFYSADAPIEVLLFPDGKTRSPLVALIPIDADMPERVHTLMRLWRPLHGRKPLADKRVTRQQRRRLRLMLQAHDGRTNGASYREIAVAIYGEARVSTEPWKTSPLRDSVIGLIEGGSAMVSGGYLNLLRHRRRS